MKITQLEENEAQELAKQIDQLQEEKRTETAEKNESINSIREEKKRIKAGDKELLGVEIMPGDRLGFYLGIGIEIILTLFLILFYSSVIYSAFMLDVNNAVLEAIKNGKLFSTAIVNLESIPQSFKSVGFLGPVFLLSATFIFLALGYLIHQFGKYQQYLKAASIYIFTFIFDSLLAYEIVRKIHIANFNSGTIEEPWRFEMAFTELSFWIILCSGFGIYVIYGLILDYIIKEYNQLQPKIIALNARDAKIKKLEQDQQNILNKIDDQIDILNKKISSLRSKISEKRESISLNNAKITDTKKKIDSIRVTREIDTHAIKGKANAFTIGWINFIVKNSENQERQKQISKCSEMLEKFLIDLRETKNNPINFTTL